jgi:hypothetical protein
MDMLLELLGPWPCPCDVSIGSSRDVPLRDSHHFLMIALVLFFKLIFHVMFLRGTQILHFRTKFCILLTLMIS